MENVFKIAASAAQQVGSVPPELQDALKSLFAEVGCDMSPYAADLLSEVHQLIEVTGDEETVKMACQSVLFQLRAEMDTACWDSLVLTLEELSAGAVEHHAGASPK